MIFNTQYPLVQAPMAGVQTSSLCIAVSPIHRQALQSDAARHTALTNLFSGRPARGIVNRLMRELDCLSEFPPEFPLATAGLAPLRAKAESLGSGDFSPLWAGQNASECKNASAAQITHELSHGFNLITKT